MCRVIELFDKLPQTRPLLRKVKRRDLQSNRDRVRVSWFALTQIGVGMTWTSLVGNCTSPVLRYDRRSRKGSSGSPNRFRLQANTQ